MVETASREIMWNVSGIYNVVAMYGLLALCLAVGLIGIFRHSEIVLSGKAAPEYRGNTAARLLDLYEWGLFQKGVIRSKAAGLAHTLVYVGFLVLLFTTTMVFIDHDLGIEIYQGRFYLLVTLLSDIFGLALIFGVLIFAHRRYIEKPDLIHTQAADGFLLGILALLCVQGFLLEGLRIHATEDPWAPYSPVGWVVAQWAGPLSISATKTLHYIIWWFHTFSVFALVALFPYTKAFHILASSVNLYFRRSGRPKGALQSPGDLEKLLEAGDDFTIGNNTIKDYSWKQLLDLTACTSCGRCQDACPAYNSGKPLSPKWLILDTRNHAYALHAQDKLTESKVPQPLRALDQSLLQSMLLKQSGLRSNGDSFDAHGEFRAANQLAQNSCTNVGGTAERSVAGDVIHEDVFWSCTTCYACVNACPVGINHVDQIIANRRNMVLMRGEVPSEAQATLRALENRGNPYGPREERTSWLQGLDVPILKPGDSVEYLYWVGCVSSFDKRKQKIAQSLAKIMKSANLSFGIFGIEEGCSGDPARRIGEENLYQTLAKKNIELLRSVRFENIVANCPHCFNTIKNEYPQFGNLGEGREPRIIHHSVLLRDLLNSGVIAVKDSAQSITFHDPCYLGRYNDEYDAPRETLTKIKGLKIIEMEESREKGLCCGAGGGHMWFDMKIGTRINSKRAEQAAETGAPVVATACPFCMQMLEDGVKLTGKDESLAVKDIAEVIAENLRENEQPTPEH